MELYQQSDIKHIAFIMDGNGRWAKKRNLPRHLGHKAGVERIKDIVKECYNLNFEVVSFFCFSSENWNRPQDEIDHLFEYLELFFKNYLDDFNKKGIKVIVSGDISRLPEKTQKIIQDSLNKTVNNTKLVFNVCLNYGGREEIVKICRDFVKDYQKDNSLLDKIDSNFLRKYLYIGELPDVDLLVRTSGEERISNFMLYNLAYSEFIFNGKYWPDYTVDDLHDDILIYMKRNRRFGEIKEEKGE